MLRHKLVQLGTVLHLLHLILCSLVLLLPVGSGLLDAVNIHFGVRLDFAVRIVQLPCDSIQLCLQCVVVLFAVGLCLRLRRLLLLLCRLVFGFVFHVLSFLSENGYKNST
ncbi:hypothetical protein [Ruminococcus sp.]|uniref:hypothetical protein n=1 Tax=Ruminococcus sp. TaxID=41978 RepID=UPI00307B96DE